MDFGSLSILISISFYIFVSSWGYVFSHYFNKTTKIPIVKVSIPGLLGSQIEQSFFCALIMGVLLFIVTPQIREYWPSSSLFNLVIILLIFLGAWLMLAVVQFGEALASKIVSTMFNKWRVKV